MEKGSEYRLIREARLHKRGLWKKLLSFLLSCFILLGITQNSHGDEIADHDLYARGAVLMDGASGRVVYEKNGSEPMAMASTTKIMTCILILEKGDLEDTATVSKYAAGQPKVKLYLKQGETIGVRELLYSMMLESHNDSAMCLAEYLVDKLGIIEEQEDCNNQIRMLAFAELMNEKAKEIGCRDTYFITPNGIDAELNEKAHHTTPLDLAKIMAYCILQSEQREVFLEITGTRQMEISWGGRRASLRNHNALLASMEGAISGKTGFTGRAGYCYVGAIKKDGIIWIAVVLASGWPSHREYKWKDVGTMLRYGQTHFKALKVAGLSPEHQDKLPKELYIPNGAKEQEIKKGCYLGVQLLKNSRVEVDTTVIGEGERITQRLFMKKHLSAPIKKGEQLGELRYSLEGLILKREYLVAAENINQVTFGDVFLRIFTRFLQNNQGIL